VYADAGTGSARRSAGLFSRVPSDLRAIVSLLDAFAQETILLAQRGENTGQNPQKTVGRHPSKCCELRAWTNPSFKCRLELVIEDIPNHASDVAAAFARRRCANHVRFRGSECARKPPPLEIMHMHTKTIDCVQSYTGWIAPDSVDPVNW